MNLLMSKLVLPPAREVIARPLYDSLADTICQKLFTLVSASPGYGKTTCIAEAVRRLDRAPLWYRLDESDDNLDTFLSYLSTAIRKKYPSFDPAWHSATSAGGYGFVEIRILAGRFLAELERAASEKICLILDDYHAVQNNLEITYFMQLILDRASPLLSIVVITRSLPNLKTSTLLADRQMHMIGERDLSFSAEELSRFLAEYCGLNLSGQQARNLHARTSGWISGLILCLGTSATGQPNDERLLEEISGSQRNIYNYFDENVFHPLPPDFKLFTLKTSILATLSGDFCDSFLGIKNSRSTLRDLEDGPFFTSPVDGQPRSYVYHPLFQEFLRAKLDAEMGGDEIVRLSSGAAALYENVDDDQEALKHHIQAGNVKDASRLLTHLARPLIKQGRPQMVKSLLSSLPEQHMVDEPWFQYLQAGYLGLCNQLHLAVKGYEKVLKLFRTNEDEEGECVCRMELAEYYMSKGDFKRSEQEYKRILNKNNTDAYLTIIVIGYLIRALTLSRKSREADSYAKQATELLKELGDEISLNTGRGWIAMAQGFRYAFTGDYHKALELGEHCRTLFASAGQFRFMSSSYYLISNACFYLGQFDRGMASAIRGLDIDFQEGICDEFSEFLRLLRVRNWLETDDVSSDDVVNAVSECKASLESFTNNNFPVGVAQANLVLHKAYLRGGDVSQAESCLRNGIASLQDHDMPLLENELRVALAQLLFFQMGKKHRKEAMILLKGAEEQLLTSSWHMCWVSRIYARYYWEYGHRDTTHKYLVYSLKISEEEGFDAWIVSEKEWLVPLLVDLLSLDSMSSYINRLFAEIGPDAERDLLSLQKNGNKTLKKTAGQLLDALPKRAVPPINASLFGRFSLRVGNEVVADRNWTSKKARTLFKYLLSKHHRGYVDKEILMELLWPSDEPQKSVQRFHVALAALRKTLEPNIEKGTKSSYIKRSGSSYRIDIGDDGYIDTLAFRETIEQAHTAADRDEAILLLKQVEALYLGDFLEEDPYDDWCREERENFRDEYLGVLDEIIRYHEGRSELTECVLFCNKYLRVDRYSEQVTRRLMKCYSSSGNVPMVIKTYEQFNETLSRELECQASEETHDLYANLVTS